MFAFKQSIFETSKSVELSSVLISLNSKFQNNDWVDRLTWRMFKLVKLLSTQIRGGDNSTVMQKAYNLLKSQFWSQNVNTYKITSGLLPQMLKLKTSEWFLNLAKTSISDKIKLMMPKTQ